MKKTSILFNYLLLFILLQPFLSNAQYEINQTTENAIFYLYDESILITPIDSDIVLSGEFFTYEEFNEISILIVPQNGFSIRVIPNLNENKTSIGVTDDDDKSISLINIYPNPTKNNLTINTRQKIKNIEIYNIYGIKQKVDNNKNTLDLKNYKKGIYMLRIHIENNQIITKTIRKQ